MALNEYMKSRQAHIDAGRPLKEKKVYGLNKVSPKRQAKIDAEKKERGDDDTDLVRFFKKAMGRMTGYCMNCSARTETKEYSAAIFSIAHILDKRDKMFPSVKDNFNNWIELCPDCHKDFDTPPFVLNKTLWDKREAMGIWPVVWKKLLQVYPSIATDELFHLPTDLRERIEKTLNQKQ
jgi:hypothetical protein